MLDSELLCTGRSPLVITFLKSRDSWSHRLTQASLSFYLAVNPYCCWRAAGSEEQIAHSKHTHTVLGGNNDTSAKGCLATGCVRDYSAQEHTHTHIHTPLLCLLVCRHGRAWRRGSGLGGRQCIATTTPASPRRSRGCRQDASPSTWSRAGPALAAGCFAATPPTPDGEMWKVEDAGNVCSHQT